MTSTPIGKASAKIVAGSSIAGYALNGWAGLVAALGMLIAFVGFVELCGLAAKSVAEKRSAEPGAEPKSLLNLFSRN